ncbi:MAG: TonB-dependent receptor [Saprospiraceae bacterium]|nr:TonB-dependent receptor [Saprospiraceae bacterium]MDP4999680.1 TonB-dependent receptor [Saprospiraceae bacterium]
MKFTFLKETIGLLLSLFLLGGASLHAQQTISGKVTASDKEPLIGVNVQIKNTGTGTTTDVDGSYSIEAGASDVLVFSYIGFAAQEIAVGDQRVIDVVLEPDANILDEVVVLGYGSVKKSDLTGSVATVTGSQIAKIPITSAAQAITGRLPGVNVLTTDGSPDAEVVIRVRGGGSITQDNSPLYVVDGFIVNSIRDIPPTDIESINVLKDAAATAIYGAQASNGVIVITTKNPVAGKIAVSYNGFVQTKQLPGDRKFEVLSPYEFVMANYEVAKLRSDADVRNFERFFGKYDDLELYKNKRPTDWQDELFGEPQLSQYHNVSISGGTETTKLSLSFTNNTDEGLLLGSGFTRNVINFKLNQKLSKKLTFEASARLNNTVVDGAGTSGNAQINIKDAVQTRPVNGIADELEIDLNSIDPNDDFQAFLRSLVNPTELVKQDWRKRTTNDYILNGALNWNIRSNLDFKSTFTSAKTFDGNLRFYGPLTSESFNNGGNLPLGEKTNRELFTYRWLNTLSYQVENLGNHSLDLLAGHEIYSAGGTVNFIRSEDFRLSITPEELFANMTFGRTDRLETSELTNSNRLSFFGRANYQFKDKYLFTATLRSDASSKFGADNRLGIFPAFAVGWKISEEGFLADSDFISELKLRASYGQTGNDRIDPTATQFLFVGSTLRGPGFGNVDNPYYTPTGSTLYNPNIKWETTTNRNLGLDFSLNNGRINGTLDVYRNTTEDLLLQSAIPSNTGFRTQWNNIGTTSNQGIELGLSAFLIDKRDVSLTFNFNIGKNKASVDELDGTTDRFFQSNWASTDLKDQDDFYVRVGGTLGDIYGYVTDGYYSTSDFASYDPVSGNYTLNDGVANSGATVGNTRIRPGYLKLKDLNGDGVINSLDRTVIGNTLPKHQGGFGLDFRYKNFDVSAFFNWTYGNDVYNTGKIQYNQFRRVNYGNMLNTMSLDNRFSYIDIEGSFTGTPGEVVTDLATLAQMNAGKNIWSHTSFGVAQATIHSWAVEDGSHLRLNNVNLGYTLPAQLTSRLGISQLRIYATGNNLKLWTNYSGYDPEVSTSRSSAFSALTPGVDYSAFPRSRSYTFGVNVTF